MQRRNVVVGGRVRVRWRKKREKRMGWGKWRRSSAGNARCVVCLGEGGFFFFFITCGSEHRGQLLVGYLSCQGYQGCQRMPGSLNNHLKTWYCSWLDPL